MPRASVVVSSKIERTARVMQLEGLFDVPPSERAELRWDVDLPLQDQPWNVGLIVGPSGSGKSTVARELFGRSMISGHRWPKGKSLLDAFPVDMSIKDIVELLSSVGFSSPPSWTRSFSVLSTGEQFRVTMARAMAEGKELTVVDEFTSVIDRTVAQIGSAAIAKTVRRRKQQFIAVTCHFDVEAWLQPDWIYRPDLNQFQWRELQRRPSIPIVIRRVHHSAWSMFKRHHYLDTSLANAAVCFVAFWDEIPVAFTSWISAYGRGMANAWREHRTVTLPDYQGVGIGNRVSEWGAALWKGLGQRVFSTTSHPAMIRYRNQSPLWAMRRGPGLTPRDTDRRVKRATARLSAGFQYVGPSLDRAEAERVLNREARPRKNSAAPLLEMAGSV